MGTPISGYATLHRRVAASIRKAVAEALAEADSAGAAIAADLVAEEREAIARMADEAAEEECLYLFRNFAKQIRAR